MPNSARWRVVCVVRRPSRARAGPTSDADDQVAEDRRQAHEPADDDDDDGRARAGRGSMASVAASSSSDGDGGRLHGLVRTAPRATCDGAGGYTSPMNAAGAPTSAHAPRARPHASTRRARSRSRATCSRPRRARSTALAARLRRAFVDAVRADPATAAGRVVVSRHRQVRATSRASSPRRSPRPARRRSSCTRPKRTTATSA